MGFNVCQSFAKPVLWPKQKYFGQSTVMGTHGYPWVDTVSMILVGNTKSFTSFLLNAINKIQHVINKLFIVI